MLVILQLLNVFDFFHEKENGKADNLLIDSFFNRNTAVLLEANSRDVLEGLNTRWVYIVEETSEIDLILVPIETKDHFDFFLVLLKIILF